MTSSPGFWRALDQLVDDYPLVVDRPRGMPHPRIAAYVYPLDYGYLDGSHGGDGQGIDVWLGSGGSRVTGVLATVDPFKRDAEVKVLIGCTPDDVRLITEFYAPQPQQFLHVARPPAA